MGIIKDFNEREGTMFRHGLILSVGLFNILIVIIGGFFIVNTGSIIHGNEISPPQLNVTGEGKISVRPDVAIFTVTSVTSAARAGDAQNQNAVRSNAVINFLKQNGVQEKDIKTVNYSIQPQYVYDDKRPCSSIACPVSGTMPPRIVSYEVRHSLEIRVRDLNSVDDILQGVVSAGGNDVSSIMFKIDDEKLAMAEARKRAIEDATQKAHILARDLGVRLVKITGFSETGTSPVYGRSFAADSAKSEVAPAPQVEAGEQEITSNVTITYEFR